eukprot:gene3552-4426_t
MKFYYLNSESVAEDSDKYPEVTIEFDIDAQHNNPERISAFLVRAERKMQHLFKTVGINDEFELEMGSKLFISRGRNSGVYNSTGNNSNPDEPYDSLLDFVQQYSNIAREKARITVEEERQVDIMYTFFYMEHKVRVLFSDFDTPMSTRKNLMRDLEQTLNQISPRIANDRIINQIFNDDKSTQFNNRNNRENNMFNNVMMQQQQQQQQQQENLNLKNKGFGMDADIGGNSNRYINFDTGTSTSTTGDGKTTTTNNGEQPFESYGGAFSKKNRESWRGWEKIKSGYITPETTPKTDDCHINEKLEGVSIVFSNRNGIDLEGRLLLDQTKPKSWKKVLLNFKPSEIINNLQNCQKRKLLETEIAKKFNVISFSTDYSEQNTPEYLEFLNQIYLDSNIINEDLEQQQENED